MKKFLLIFIISFTSVFGFDINDLKSFQASFVQTVQNSSGKNLEYSGVLYISQNNVLWKYFKPIEKNVYVKNDFVIIDEPELEQAIYTQIDQEINLFDLIKEAKKIDENHYVATLKNVQYNVIIKEEKIDSVYYIDSLENEVKIEFLEPKQNIQINEELFVFVAPNGYDIIRK